MSEPDGSWPAMMSENFGSEGFEMSDTLEERARVIAVQFLRQPNHKLVSDDLTARITPALQEAEARGRRKGLFTATDVAAKADLTPMFPQFEPTDENRFLWETAQAVGVMNAVLALNNFAQEDKP